MSNTDHLDEDREIILPSLFKSMPYFKRFPFILTFEDKYEESYLAWWFEVQGGWFARMLLLLCALHVVFLGALYLVFPVHAALIIITALGVVSIVCGVVVAWVSIRRPRPSNPRNYALLCCLGSFAIVFISMLSFMASEYDPANPSLPIVVTLTTMAVAFLFSYQAHYTSITLVVSLPLTFMVAKPFILPEYDTLDNVIFLNIISTFATGWSMCYFYETKLRLLFVASGINAENRKAIQPNTNNLLHRIRLYIFSNPQKAHHFPRARDLDFAQYYAIKNAKQLRFAVFPVMLGNLIMLYQDITVNTPEYVTFVVLLRIFGTVVGVLLLLASNFSGRLRIPIKWIPVMTFSGAMILSAPNIIIVYFQPYIRLGITTYILAILRNLAHVFIALKNRLLYEMIVCIFSAVAVMVILYLRGALAVVLVPIGILLAATICFGVLYHIQDIKLEEAHFKRYKEATSNLAQISFKATVNSDSE